jgi:hypothetical protein
MNIAIDVAGTVHDTMERLACGWNLRFTFDSPSAQFIPPELAERIEMPMRAGDIIRCVTNPNHLWGISELIEVHGNGNFLLREIGGNRLCNMGNESVHVLRFMHPSRLYTGSKYKIYQWIITKAFSERYNPDGDYLKRCGGVQFDGDMLTIWSRPHIWSMEKVNESKETLYAHPKKFTMQWSDKTKLRDIINSMKDQGFADDFEFFPEKPTEGQTGFVTFTRDRLMASLQSL